LSTPDSLLLSSAPLPRLGAGHGIEAAPQLQQAGAEISVVGGDLRVGAGRYGRFQRLEEHRLGAIVEIWGDHATPDQWSPPAGAAAGRADGGQEQGGAGRGQGIGAGATILPAPHIHNRSSRAMIPAAGGSVG